jgi:AcrR family transcriptional regulator
MNTWLLDENDPLEYGFLLGSERQMPEEGIRARIVKAAWKLFNEKGYEQTSVEDILSVTGMTQSEFNSEFACKECLLDTLSDLFDEKYSELMVEMNPRFSHYEKLLHLNRELFAMIEKEIPFDMVAVLYVKNTEEKQLLNENRLYYKLILQIVTEGQKHGEFKSDISAEEMAGMYTSLERGMVYNWCVTDGKESLKETGRRLLPIYLKEILL